MINFFKINFKEGKIPFCYAYYPNLLRVIINMKYIEIIKVPK